MKEARQIASKFKQWYIYAIQERRKTVKLKKIYADKYEYLSEMIAEAKLKIDKNEDMKAIITFERPSNEVIASAYPALIALIKRLLIIEDKYYEHGDIDKRRVL